MQNLSPETAISSLSKWRRQRQRKVEDGRCQRCIRARRDYCSGPGTPSRGSSASNSLRLQAPAWTRPSSPLPSSVISPRSSPSAPRWIDSGAPSLPNPSVISGKGFSSVSLSTRRYIVRFLMFHRYN